MINDIAGVGFSLSKELIKMGHDVTLLAKKSKIYTYPSWVRIYDNKLDEFFLKKINLNDFDIIHLHYLTNWASLGLFFRKTKKPILLHAHGSDTRPNNILTKVVQRLIMTRSNFLLYSTPDLKDNLKWFKGKLIHLPNPIPVQKKTLKVNKYHDRILIFSALNKAKKIEKTFPVIKNLKYSFDIIESGKDKEYYKKIMPKNVFFIKPVRHDGLIRLLSGYKLVIGQQTSHMGMSELESMSCGIPTSFPFRYGKSYPEAPPTFMVTDENIRKYFGNKKLGKKQKDWLIKYHEAKVVTDRLVKVYHDIIFKD